MAMRPSRAATRSPRTARRSTRTLVELGTGVAAGAAALVALLVPVGPVGATPEDGAVPMPDAPIVVPMDVDTLPGGANAGTSGVLPQAGSGSTQLMLGGGLVALGLGSITAMLTRRRDDGEVYSLT